MSTPVQPARPHRHTWIKTTTFGGQIGYGYVWYRCQDCGKRRVETVGPGAAVIARRYVEAKR